MDQAQSRIPKTAFIVSSSILLAVCLIASAVRCYIRFQIQRQFGWDDVFLIIGLCCLIAGMTIFLIVIDAMYLFEYMLYGLIDSADFDITKLPQMTGVTANFHLLATVAIALSWFSLGCVKLCFLAFFRKLIRQMPAMISYWLFALLFTIMSTVVGTILYSLKCPSYRPDQIVQSLQCVKGSGLHRTYSMTASLMALDIAADLFILVIPVILVWKIRVRWTQKLALAFTLCLTILSVIISITRFGGLVWKGRVDVVWEIYFVGVAAEIGHTLVAMTTFRALYVSTVKSRRTNKTITTFGWYTKGRARLQRLVTRTSSKNSGGRSSDAKNNLKDKDLLKDEIPHGTMTGMRTFMVQHGRSNFHTTLDEEKIGN